MIQTTQDRLARAAEIGRKLRAIDDDPTLHRLSRKAWLRHCLELGNFSSLQQLEAARARIAVLPHLSREMAITARLWADGLQDRPAVFAGFADGERFPSCYAELLASGLSLAAVSAIASYAAAERRPDASFGKLAAFSDLDAVTGPLLAELAQLDDTLRTTLHLLDLSWQAGAPFLAVGPLMVPIGPESVDRLATATAEAARLTIRSLAAVA